MKRSFVQVVQLAIISAVLVTSPSLCSHVVSDCGGSYVTFSGQSKSDIDAITQIPGGSILLSMTATNQQAIPEGVVLMKLIRRDADDVIVPCLDGVSGSCQLDLCDFIINFPDMISIPVAGCPIPMASYRFNTNLLFDELWLPVNEGLQNATYNIRYELKVEQEVIGCFTLPIILTTDLDGALETSVMMYVDVVGKEILDG